MVGVEAHLFPLIHGQRPRLLPGAGTDRDPPEVVDERRAPNRDRLDGRQAATLGRRRRQLRDAGRVTGEVGRDQVREAAHRLERPIDRLPLQRQPRLRLA